MIKFIKLHGKNLNPVSSLRSIYQYKDLLWQLLQRNVQAKYKGTLLGAIWMIITPVLMLSVYTFVFSVILKVRWGSSVDDSKMGFALTIFCGLAVFNIFSESINSSTGIITCNQNYVKKVIFPLETLPVASVLSALFFGLIWLIILLAAILVFMHKLYFTTVALPIVLLPLLLLSCGISFFTSSLGVFYRDIQHVVAILLQILFFLTPIFYPIIAVPELFRKIIYLNPMAGIVQSARNILIFNSWPNWGSLLISLALSLFIFQAGYFWFMKTKKGFADVL